MLSLKGGNRFCGFEYRRRRRCLLSFNDAGYKVECEVLAEDSDWISLASCDCSSRAGSVSSSSNRLSIAL